MPSSEVALQLTKILISVKRINNTVAERDLSYRVSVLYRIREYKRLKALLIDYTLNGKPKVDTDWTRDFCVFALEIIANTLNKNGRHGLAKRIANYLKLYHE